MRLDKPLSRRLSEAPKIRIPNPTGLAVLGPWSFVINEQGDLLIVHESGRQIILGQSSEPEESPEE